MKADRAVCRLCRSCSELCDSHIIPEFMYASLYDDKHKMVSYRYGEHRITKQPLQKGLGERLLCEACESHLNRNFEQPNIERWMRLSEMSPGKDGARVSVENGDYSSFKLLLLSILWRASVAARPEFHKVRLGPHEDRIRQMLLTLEPGEETQYPLSSHTVQSTHHCHFVSASDKGGRSHSLLACARADTGTLLCFWTYQGSHS